MGGGDSVSRDFTPYSMIKRSKTPDDSYGVDEMDSIQIRQQIEDLEEGRDPFRDELDDDPALLDMIDTQIKHYHRLLGIRVA